MRFFRRALAWPRLATALWLGALFLVALGARAWHLDRFGTSLPLMDM